ncbi:MAG: hypothetical protein K8R36_25210 [Planctomycetales bacterium]|nr:hypothetical protein [Planctomycetales bacterium]
MLTIVSIGLGYAMHERRIAWDELQSWNALKKQGVHLSGGEGVARRAKWLRVLLGDDLYSRATMAQLGNGAELDQSGPAALIATLKKFKHLESLSCHSKNLTDAGLGRLTELTQLRKLTLSSPRITNAGLIDLLEFENLQSLTLSDTSITDSGMRTVSRLHHLRELDLSSTEISDAGLAHLSKLDNLTILDLRRTRVTNSGLQAIQKALPNCKINGHGLGGFGAGARNIRSITSVNNAKNPE